MRAFLAWIPLSSTRRRGEGSGGQRVIRRNDPNDRLSYLCSRCGVVIVSKAEETTEGCRYNGDAFGQLFLTCQSCRMVQQKVWDDHSRRMIIVLR